MLRGRGGHVKSRDVCFDLLARSRCQLASRRHRRRQIHGMIPRSAKQPGRPDEAYQLLPNNNDDDDVLFTASDGDSDDDFQAPARLPDPSAHKTGGRSVRFEEDVHVIAPPLRSTAASREAGSYTGDQVDRMSLRYARI